jgi:hypothetical protein
MASRLASLLPDWFHSTGSGAVKAPNTMCNMSVGGQKIAFGIDHNRCPYQQDRVAMFTIPQDRYTEECAANLMDAAIERAQVRCAGVKSSGSTLIMAHYDPERYTVDLRNIGDSFAYLVLEGRDQNDEKRHVTVKISPSTHEIMRIKHKDDIGERDRVMWPVQGASDEYFVGTSSMLDALGPDYGSYNVEGAPALTAPALGPVYHFQNHELNAAGFIDNHHKWHTAQEAMFNEASLHNGVIDLHQFKKRAAEQFGLSEDGLKLSLLLTSDGMDMLPRNEIGAVLATGRGKLSGLFKRCGNGGENDRGDNLSAALIENLRPGKGPQVYALLCDGFGLKGNRTAQHAIDAVRDHIQEKFRLPPPNLARSVYI